MLMMQTQTQVSERGRVLFPLLLSPLIFLQATVKDKLISWDRMAVTMERACNNRKQKKKKSRSSQGLKEVDFALNSRRKCLMDLNL